MHGVLGACKKGTGSFEISVCLACEARSESIIYLILRPRPEYSMYCVMSCMPGNGKLFYMHLLVGVCINIDELCFAGVDRRNTAAAADPSRVSTKKGIQELSIRKLFYTSTLDSRALRAAWRRARVCVRVWLRT